MQSHPPKCRIQASGVRTSELSVDRIWYARADNMTAATYSGSLPVNGLQEAWWTDYACHDNWIARSRLFHGLQKPLRSRALTRTKPHPPDSRPAGTGHLPAECRRRGKLAILNICRAKFQGMLSLECISFACPSCGRTSWGLFRLQTKPNCGPERRASWRRPTQGANGRVVKTCQMRRSSPFRLQVREGNPMKVHAAFAAFAASPAFGHLGHVNDTATAGHSHWLAIGSIVMAFAITFFLWVRRCKNSIFKDASTGNRLPEDLRQ